MSRRQPDLESGMSRSSTSEKQPAGIGITENGSSYPIPKSDTSNLDAPYLREFHDAVDGLEEAYHPEAKRANHKRNGKDNFFSWVKRRKLPVRAAFYLAPLVVLLVIPIALLKTIFFGKAFIYTWTDDGVHSVHTAGLFVWLEIVVVALWVALSLSWLSTTIFGRGCDFFKNRFPQRQLLFNAVKDISTNLMVLPITLVLWTIISFASTPAVCVFNDDSDCVKTTGWIYNVNRAFEAGIVVSFLLWVERLVIGMSFISYYGKQYDSKHSVLNADINKVKNLFYLTLHRSPKHEHNFLSEAAQFCSDCKHAGAIEEEKCWSLWKWENDWDWNLVFDKAIGSEETALHIGTYLWYCIKLDGNESDLSSLPLAEAMHELKKDIYTRHLKDWIFHRSEKFSEKLKKSKFTHNDGARYTEDEDGEYALVKEYTDILNGDNDDDITYEEMRTAIKRLGKRRENLEKTLYNVREAMESLDRPLLVVLLIAVAFVYAAFFVSNFNTYATAIFTAFTGLGFALSGTVTDFLTSCIFLFVKHPYHVGDRIEINKVQLEVDRIALMTTRFARVDNRKIVQMPHSLLNTYWIENLSRSKRLKEYLTIAVSPDTEFSTIDAIREDLKRFVKMNARDFKQESERIELLAIDDLTQMKLEVEVEHKFKYFDDDVHADRQVRFKRALLHFLREKEVLPPNVDPVAIGDPWRPTYSVTASMDQLASSQGEFNEKRAKLRRKNTEDAEPFRVEPPSRGRRSRAGTPLGTQTPR